MAEKGGSRTLRGPYDPQTGFEDQRHHRAPSFSDNVFRLLSRYPLFPFINSFINLRGPEGVGDVDPLATPFGESPVSQVVKEFLDACLLERFLYLIMYQPFRYRPAVVQGEHEPLQIRDYRSASFLRLDLVEYLSGSIGQRRDLLDAGLLATAIGHDHTANLVDHILAEPEQIRLGQTCSLMQENTFKRRGRISAVLTALSSGLIRPSPYLTYIAEAFPTLSDRDVSGNLQPSVPLTNICTKACVGPSLARVFHRGF